MSTYLYLQCRSHNPPIWSDSHVGSSLSDVPYALRLLENRAPLIAVRDLADDDVAYGAQFSGYAGAAAWFLTQHRDCEVVLIDQYGETHTHPEKNTSTQQGEHTNG